MWLIREGHWFNVLKISQRQKDKDSGKRKRGRLKKKTDWTNRKEQLLWMTDGERVGINDGKSDMDHRRRKVETDLRDFEEIRLSIRSLGLPKFNLLISYISF